MRTIFHTIIRKRSGQAVIEFAVSAVFIIVFAFMATRIAQWFVMCMWQRAGNYNATRVPGGTGFAAPDAELKLID